MQRLSARRGTAGTVAVLGPFVDAQRRAYVLNVGPLGTGARVTRLDPMGAPLQSSPYAGSSEQNYGHIVALCPDLDGDGLPSPLVADSHGCLSERVELWPGTPPRCEPRMSTFLQARGRMGSSLSLDPSGRYVLASGGAASMPEFLEVPGEAVLLKLSAAVDGDPRIDHVGTWVTQVGLRSAESPK